MSSDPEQWVDASQLKAAPATTAGEPSEPTRDFSFKYDKLRRKFEAKFGRPLRQTGGGDTRMHRLLHHGDARDVGSKELTEDQRNWLVEYGKKHDLQVADYTYPQNNPNRRKEPHVHIQMIDSHPPPGAGDMWVDASELKAAPHGLAGARVNATGVQAPPPPAGFWKSAAQAAGIPTNSAEAKQLGEALWGTAKVLTVSGGDSMKAIGAAQQLVAEGKPEVASGLASAQADDIADFHDEWVKAGRPGPREIAELHMQGSDIGRKLVRAAIPIFGRNITRSAEQFREGNVRGGLGTAVGTVAAIAGPKALKTLGGALKGGEAAAGAKAAEAGATVGEWVDVDRLGGIPGATVRPAAEAAAEAGAGIRVNAGEAGGGTGAGAMRAGTRLAQSEIKQFGEAVKAKAAAEAPSKLEPLAPEPKPPSFVTSLRKRGAAAIRNAADWYREGAVKPYSNVDDAAMQFKARTDAMAIDARQFAKDVVKAVPDKARRDAIYRYASAQGEAARTGQTVEQVLADWAARGKGNSRTGYTNVLKLTDTEKATASNFQAFFEPLLAEGTDAGVIRTAIEDYVPQVVKRGPPGSKMQTAVDHMRGDMEASLLNPNFKHARQRVFPNIFEGEQAGYTYNTDFAEVSQRYYMSMGRAIESRKLLKSLNGMKAADGRPVVTVRGGVRVIPDKNAPQAVLIKPGITPDAAWDYRPVENWAFKGWKWVDATGGTNEFMQGDLLVHPDYAKAMAARFQRGRIAATRGLRTVLKGQAQLKATMFSLAPFHLVTEAEHALGHRVLPLNLAPLDTSSPALMEALHGGLQVAGGAGSEMFAEGLAGGGLVSKIPGVGRLNARFAEWLFHDYIPRLKYKTYEHILERNMERYGPVAQRKQLPTGIFSSTKELSRQQIVSLSADQANAAYGELNYFKMARSKTYQDLSRLFFTAPDFFEARGRFTARALRGYGAEQRQALGTLALSNYALARVFNQLDHGDAQWDPKDAFVFVHNGQRYTMRTVPGDVLHGIEDPQGFLAWRLNPFLVIPPVEWIFGEDLRGGKTVGHGGKYELKRRKDAVDILGETAESAIPIPLQGAAKVALGSRKGDVIDELERSALQSVGVVPLPPEK
jgi:hypothetical protein